MTAQTVNATANAKLKDSEGKLTGETEEREGSVEYDFGDNLDEAAERFGAEAVFNQYKQAAVISLQSRMRSALSQGKTDDELQEVADNWKPGARQVTRKSPSEKLADLFKGKTPEEIQTLLQEAGIATE